MADLTTPAYEVTATKRRPKTFDELAGQEFVVSTLKNSLKSGSIAHAYLFSGPRGCGKTSAARILARSLNCDSPVGGNLGEPCGHCDNCRSIAAGSNMDVIEIDGASNTGVNDVRQIKDEVLFPPQSGRYKVYIIDEVHMLTTNAFNALLKTIEEPPPYVIFIFATTEIHKVPATIKSRCQQFSFRLIPIETIQALLKKICDEMEIKADDNALFWIARESTGSLRDAFTLFDQVVSFSGGHINENLIREKLGLAGLEKINSLAEACAANDIAGALSQVDAILGSGVAIEQLVIDLAGYYRSLMLLKNGITRESLLGNSPNQFSAKVLETLDWIRLEQAIEILLDCYRDMRYSVSPRYEFELAVSKLSWLNKWISPMELKAAMDRAQSVMRGQVGSVGALSGGTSIQDKPSAPKQMPQNSSVPKEGNSLSDELRRMMAAKARPAQPAAILPNDEPQPSPQGEGSPLEPQPSPQGEGSPLDDDEPVWRTGSLKSDALDGAAQNNTATANEAAAELPEDRVIRLIPGTVVN
ncbi:MAG: DNA polymerase III subunit gamma/tau [Treponema sp.]|jgi:DNA polymerase-3 subunit gamma/tau|nr:DNA polymerase III subunit gamma/tau [Treponema sp.]